MIFTTQDILLPVAFYNFLIKYYFTDFHLVFVILCFIKDFTKLHYKMLSCVYSSTLLIYQEKCLSLQKIWGFVVHFFIPLCRRFTQFHDLWRVSKPLRYHVLHSSLYQHPPETTKD